LPKDLSFRRPALELHPTLDLDGDEESVKRHQRKLEKSNVDVMISKTKGELSAVNRVLKKKQDEEREA
jgi:hypothetical protein